jgi:hypothetical protein
MPTEISTAAKRKQARDPNGKFAAGDSARFSGQSADGAVSGDMDVKVINPWSNKERVTSTDNRGQPYEGAHQHIPTATVERAAYKSSISGERAAKQFEAYHHTLSKR